MRIVRDACCNLVLPPPIKGRAGRNRAIAAKRRGPLGINVGANKDAADRIAPRLNRAQIEQTMHETHLDQELKDMGMWDEWANGKRGREQ